MQYVAPTSLLYDIRESEPFMPGNRQAFSTAMNTADRYRWDSHWAEAAQEYQRALAEFPDDAMARSGLGFCYMQTKQWQQALNEYEYTLKRDPSNVIALSKTAELYGILNRRGDAYRAYLHLADLYSQAGQGSRAEAAWQLPPRQRQQLLDPADVELVQQGDGVRRQPQRCDRQRPQGVLIPAEHSPEQLVVANRNLHNHI